MDDISKELNLDFNKNVYKPLDDTYLFLKYFKQFMNKDNIDGIKLNKISYILDMGTGSGIIAIFFAKYFKSNLGLNIKIYASDILLDAIKLSKKNAKKNGLENEIVFIHSNLFNNFPISLKHKFKIIFFNPPYLPSESIFKTTNKTKIDHSWDGGKKGIEIFENFLIQSIEFLSSIEKSFIYFLFSTNSDLNLLYAKIEELGFELKILIKTHFFFEDIILHRITRV